jgi:hypothetical protein
MKAEVCDFDGRVLVKKSGDEKVIPSLTHVFQLREHQHIATQHLHRQS